MTEYQRDAPRSEEHADRGAAGRDDGPAPGKYSQGHGEAPGRDGAGGGAVQVLDPQRAQGMRDRWNEVQAGFVDRPRESVNDADQLVGELLDEVSRVFREQRADLEKNWDADQSGTEDLRQALFRYREFFDRLLSL